MAFSVGTTVRCLSSDTSNTLCLSVSWVTSILMWQVKIENHLKKMDKAQEFIDLKRNIISLLDLVVVGFHTLIFSGCRWCSNVAAVWELFGTSCDKELLLLRIFLPTAVAIPPRQGKNPAKIFQRPSCWWMQNNYNAHHLMYTSFMNKTFGFKWFRFFQLIQSFFHRLHNELCIFSLFPVICFVSWRPCPWGSYISWPHGSQRVPLRAQITKNRVRSDPTLLTFGEYLNKNNCECVS